MTLTVAPPPVAPAAAQEKAPPHGRGGRWPLLPLIATVLLVAVPADDTSPWTVAGVPAADLLSGVAVLVCAGCLLFLRRRPLSPAAAVVLGLPAVGLALATVTATDPVAALPGFVRYLQVFVLVPAAVLLLVRDAAGFRAVAGALVLLAVVQGATGVHQYVTGTGASYMGEEIRAVGTFGPSDVMGMATVVGYGLVAAVAYALRTPAGTPRRLRPWAPATAALLLVPLTLSFSRGAWIATAAGVLAVIALTGLRQAARALAVLGAAGVVLVGGFGVGSEMISQRLTSITEVTSAPDRSVNDRYAMWAAAAGMWRERPATGVGLKGFPAHRDGHASIGLSAGSDTAGAGQEFRKQPLLSPTTCICWYSASRGSSASPHWWAPGRRSWSAGCAGWCSHGPGGRGRRLRSRRGRADDLADGRLPLRGHRGPLDRPDRDRARPRRVVGAGRAGEDDRRVSGTATEATVTGPPAPDAPVRPGRFLVRAAGGAAGLTVIAALLGLFRDQALARLFGASHASDAFLIAWTVPEMAATLLIEDGMALLLVPAFSLALTRRAAGGHAQDPVRVLVADTLPRLFAALACAGGLLVWGAPWAVAVLAPGLDDPRLAVDCTRLTAVTVLTFGVTGYFSAALRAHGRFLAPAGVYIAYNVGIIGMTLALHSVWGCARRPRGSPSAAC